MPVSGWRCPALRDQEAGGRGRDCCRFRRMERGGGGGSRVTSPAVPRGWGRASGGGEGAGPGVHATSASVTPPRPPGWEALRIDGCQHARAAGESRKPRGEATLESGGGCLKGQSRLLLWSGPGCGTDSDCAAFALSFSVLLLLLVFVFFWILLGLLDYYYLQRTGLLSDSQGV